MPTSTETDPFEVTEDRAKMLALHAIYVQGGSSTPEREAERARKDMSDGGAPIDWAKMQAEVDDALLKRVAALPLTAPPAPAAPTAPSGSHRAEVPARVDVTAVLGQVDQGQALRARIKTLTAELKSCEDMIKDVLGDSTVGVDATGHVVVRFPFRNRSGLVKEKVKEKLSDADYAECVTETTYRSLLYGESDS